MGKKIMDLSIKQIKQIIKEELVNVLREADMGMAEKVFTLLDSGWEHGMLIANALEGEDRNAFMGMVQSYINQRLKELQQDIDALYKKRTGEILKINEISPSNPQEYILEYEISTYDPYEQEYYNKSYLKLRNDGMIDVDLFIEPSEKLMDYMNPLRKRYQQQNNDLENTMTQLRTVYSQGEMS